MTISKEVKEKIDRLLREGKVKAVFMLLNQQTLSSYHKKTLLLIEADYHRLKEEETKGTIGFEEKEIRRNRINDRLMDLMMNSTSASSKKSKKIGISIAIFSFIALLLAAYFLWNANQLQNTCPDYDKNLKNKILIVPFTNVGENSNNNPQIVIRDDINRLTHKRKLSSLAQISEPRDITNINDAEKIAKACDANVLIWGKYSAATDSIRIILQYHFLDKPEWSNLGELITLKDVTTLQNGRITNDIADSIMSLCSIIAARQGEREVATEWLNKIKNKSEEDLALMKLLD